MGGGGGIGGIVKKGLGLLVEVGTLGIIDPTPSGAKTPQVIQPEPAPEQREAKKPKAPSRSDGTLGPDDKRVKAAKKKQRRITASGGGRSRNILTSGRGLSTEARTTRKKSLLGQ